ncbi:MAG: hypothetical protein RSC68_34975 [Acinetobacter sp.]
MMQTLHETGLTVLPHQHNTTNHFVVTACVRVLACGHNAKQMQMVLDFERMETIARSSNSPAEFHFSRAVAYFAQ